MNDINAIALSPTSAELDWAGRMLEKNTAAGGGVFTLDCQMVDAPVWRRALRTLGQSHLAQHSLGQNSPA